MSEHHYSYPISVRYADIDSQGHVNNAIFLTYFEQARINYLVNLGLFSTSLSFIDVGIILADAHVTYLIPVLFGMDVRVEVQVTRLGNKSLTMAYRMLDGAAGVELATATTVLVAFDFQKNMTIPIPALWREKISDFEGNTIWRQSGE